MLDHRYPYTLVFEFLFQFADSIAVERGLRDVRARADFPEPLREKRILDIGARRRFQMPFAYPLIERHAVARGSLDDALGGREELDRGAVTRDAEFVDAALHDGDCGQVRDDGQVDPEM